MSRAHRNRAKVVLTVKLEGFYSSQGYNAGNARLAKEERLKSSQAGEIQT